MKKVSIVLLLFLILFLISGCKEKLASLDKSHGRIGGLLGEQIDLKLLFRTIDSNVKANWSSSDEKIATVDERGIVICKRPGATVVARTTESNMTDRVIVIINDWDPSGYNMVNYDFLRVRILSDEEYNQYMRDYYNSPEENYEYQDAWDAGKEYKIVYAEIMECYNNTQSPIYIYNVGKIASFAIPKDMYDIYKDYDQMVFWAFRARLKTLDYLGNKEDIDVDMIMRDYDDLSSFNNGLAIKDNVVNISNFLELGIDVNNSVLFKVKYNYFTAENPLIIEDGTTTEELTEIFNYMSNVKW